MSLGIDPQGLSSLSYNKSKVHLQDTLLYKEAMLAASKGACILDSKVVKAAGELGTQLVANVKQSEPICVCQGHHEPHA